MDVLNRVLQDTVNSVVQYIGISGAYVPPEFDDQLAELERLRAEEAQTAHDLNEALASLDIAPKVGIFPFWNIDLNYLDVRFMARFAATHHEKAVAYIEQNLDSTREDPRIHTLLSRVLDEKRAHLATLREIGGVSETADA